MKSNLTITHARITEIPQDVFGELPKVFVRVDSGEEFELFEFYPDEIAFQENEFIGLTVEQAHELKRTKDVSYLMS